MRKATVCRLCGEVLPEQKGRGRRLEYCPDGCGAVASAAVVLQSRLLKWGSKVPQKARDRVRGEIWSAINVALGKADAKGDAKS